MSGEALSSFEKCIRNSGQACRKPYKVVATDPRRPEAPELAASVSLMSDHMDTGPRLPVVALIPVVHGLKSPEPWLQMHSSILGRSLQGHLVDIRNQAGNGCMGLNNGSPQLFLLQKDVHVPDATIDAAHKTWIQKGQIWNSFGVCSPIHFHHGMNQCLAGLVCNRRSFRVSSHQHGRGERHDTNYYMTSCTRVDSASEPPFSSTVFNSRLLAPPHGHIGCLSWCRYG